MSKKFVNACVGSVLTILAGTALWANGERSLAGVGAVFVLILVAIAICE